MSAPTPYTRQYHFSDWSNNYPTTPQSGAHLDGEFDEIKQVLDAIELSLGRVQRTDGELANLSVGLDQLKPEIVLGTPTNWATATAYALKAVVWQASVLYVCNSVHTSGVFATDLSNSLWTAYLDYADPLGVALGYANDASGFAYAASASAYDSAAAATQAGVSEAAAAASAVAAAATVAAVPVPTPVNRGGTGAITAPLALTALGAVAKAGDSLTGPLLAAADPVVALGLATKQYVDNVATPPQSKAPVAVATTANITLSAEQTIDGVLTSVSRILVKNQTLPKQNGIYTTGAGAWTRTTDMDAWSEVNGAQVFVSAGTVGAGSGWVAYAASGGVLGTDDITWTQFGGTGAFQAKSDLLSAIAGCNPETAGDVIYATGATSVAKTPSVAYGRALLNYASEAALKAGINAEAGVDFQAYDAKIAMLTGGLIGTMVATGAAAAPSGWLLCYGQAVSRVTYAALFTAIGTTFGVGDGSTTFNLPDGRGRALVGKDNMGGAAASRLTTAGSGVDGATLGAVGGEQAHTLLTAEMPAHAHTTTVDWNAGAGGAGADAGFNHFASNSGVTASTGGGGPHNNVQPALVTNIIIFAGV